MTMQTEALLVELFTEELPPKALSKLQDAFAGKVVEVLDKYHLIAEPGFSAFATPRRLAVRVEKVLEQAPEQSFEEKLVPVKIGLDADGKPTQPLLKKLASKGLSHFPVEQLKQVDDGKQLYLVAEGKAPGARLDEVLQGAIEEAINALPIPKVMRYQLADGVTTVKFVRPMHGLVCLHGSRVVPAEVLGKTARQSTRGHRFLGNVDIQLENASRYEAQLLEAGKVQASFSERRAEILRQLQDEAAKLGAVLDPVYPQDPCQSEAVADLLDEVTALVEMPKVYVGQFNPDFLQVPNDCLILTMRQNQKYFPLFNAKEGQLVHQFLIVSNMPIEVPRQIIEGNERVVRARLEDAEFFYKTDRKQPLSSHLPQLQNIVYHNKLGSQWARVERVERLAGIVASAFAAADSLLVRESQEAARLAKADLTTQLVGEFPELQGQVGGRYARMDGASEAVSEAIAHQYDVRYELPFSGAVSPAMVLFMAERLETLVGIWGIGLKPTGERDPFALRRAAMGLVSVLDLLVEKAPELAEKLDLRAFIQAAFEGFDAQLGLSSETPAEVYDFVLERYRNQLLGSHERAAVEAVFAVSPRPSLIQSRIAAVEHFLAMPEAQSLAAANKRCGNLLKKVEGTVGQVDPARFQEPAENALYEALKAAQPEVQTHLAQQDFKAALVRMAALRAPVDTFFEAVMIMAEDLTLRANRLALLAELHALMNRVADLSALVV